MSEESRLLHALKNSGIKRVAVVDDAFHPPEIVEGEWGNVLAHLKASSFIDAVKDRSSIQSKLDSGRAAIENSEFDSDELVQLIHQIFHAYVETGQAVFDPATQFSRARRENLLGVQPILKLLSRAEGVEITRIGSMESDNFAELISDIDLVFADFFLDPAVTGDHTPDDEIAQAAQRKSKEMINRIIQSRGKIPSIVLMSSKNVADRAADFRRELGPAYVAARFQFLDKGHVKIEANEKIHIADAAADTLLDIVQTFKFGEGLSAAIDLWKESVNEAVTATIQAVSELEVRDFAYLIRFRLEKEGQELLEYMEWLLGEYLVDEAARRFYLRVSEKEDVRSVTETQQSVEGAFDGQSSAVAKIYHRVRVEDPRPGRAPNMRMGDLYLSPDGHKISAVITPDCDLVVRKGKRRAKRLTLVNGNIKPFDRKYPSAAEFLLIDAAAKNIEWSKKNIETQEFDWSADATKCKKIGTLKPMYAQQLQRAVLNDLGRVGLATWPALYVTADVELWYSDQDAKPKRITIPPGTPQSCAVMPGRPMPDGPAEKHVVVFPRSLMRKVRELLGAIDPATAVAAAASCIEKLKDSETDVELSLACRGIEMETSLAQGIFVTQGNGPATGGWCWLAVRVN